MAKNNSNKDIKDIANYARFQMTMAKVGITLGILIIGGALLYALLFNP